MDPIRPVANVDGRKPDQHPDRFCDEEGCTIRLSKYNPGPNCYQHTPLKYPRIRGRSGATQ